MKLEWHLGDVVRKLRAVRGFESQEALGAAANGLDKGTINRLETRGPSGSSPETIQRVADALHTHISEMYALVPKPTESGQAINEQTLRRDELWAAIPPDEYPGVLKMLERYALLGGGELPNGGSRSSDQARTAASPPKASRTERRKKRA